ncbi:MAG: response regulator, partial [Deltaproteobacteria bacterium]|nr:response regulator [Deltaproteobacteria bacterium]
MAKILVVDDDARFRETVQALLTEEGHEPVLAENGTEALQTFNNVKPDVVVLDMLMPKMGGFDCAAALRSTPLGQRVPIIFISGAYKNTKTINEAQVKYNCAAYLLKPFNAGDLFDAIAGALGIAAPGQESAEAAPAEPLPESGRLLDTSVAHLLLRIQNDRLSGILDLFGETERARLFFLRGSACQAQTSRPDRNLGMMLVRMGHLSPYHYKALLEQIETRHVGLHDIIKEMKDIADTTVKDAYRRLIPDIMAGAVALKGQFKWYPNDQFVRYIPSTNVAILPALYSGVLQAPAALLEAHLEPRKTLRMSKGANWQTGKRHLSEGLKNDDVLKSVNGRARIAQIYGAASDAEVRRLRMAQIFMLIASDAVTLSEEAREVEPSLVQPEPTPVSLGAAPEAEVDEAKFARLGGEQPAAPKHSVNLDYDAKADAAADAGLEFSAEEQAARERIVAMFKELRDQNHYQVLSLDPAKFDLNEAKKNYFKLAKEWHADTYTGLNLGSATDKLSAIFAKISEAYDVLGDHQKKAEFDAQLALAAQGISADVGTIFKAENLFDKAKLLAERGDFTAALRELDEAVSLYPQPQIKVWHLYCGFRSRGNRPAEANTIIKQIEVELKDNRVERGWEFLGTMCRLIDD